MKNQLFDLLSKTVFTKKRLIFAGMLYSVCCSLLFTSYSFGQYNPDTAAIRAVAEGRITTANAIWWGFNSTNVTSNLQAAINSRATKLTIPNIGIPWIVDPLWLASNKEITLESGVVLKARSGSFRETDDCLLRAYDKQNITIIGYGAQIEMNKDDYTVSPYLASEGRHCLSLGGCSNVNISGLKFVKSGGDGIYVGRGTINKYSSNIKIKDVVCDNNHRNGISVTSAQNLLIENCVLKNTHGTSPQAGIDFEPNLYDDLLTNCTLKKCELSNNEKGITVVLLPCTQSSQPVSINIDSCVVQNNPSSLSVRGPNTSVPYLGYLVLHNNQIIGPQSFSQTTGLDILYEYPSTNPTIGISQLSLAFGDVIVNTASSEKTYIVQGSNLSPASGNITITPPSGYQVSAASGSGFASSLNVSYTSSKLSSKTIYVRFSPTAAQSYTGNIKNSGGGATTKNVAVTGTGISTTSPMLTVNPTSLSFGTISVNTTNQSSFTLSGSYLSPAAGNITITAPAGYTVSQTSSSGYASSITCAYTSNTLSSRTIYVRFTPTAAQSYTGTITISGGSATTKNVAVTGTGTTSTTPMLTVSNASLSFGNISINTTRLSSYTISGSNLSPAAGNITITAPAGYTISKTYDSGYSSSITCAYTGNAISSKMIYVRFTPTAVKSYTGNITNAGGGATTKNIAVTGTGTSSGTTPVLTMSNASLSFGNITINTTRLSSMTITGSNLSPAAGNITITAPAGYTVSQTYGSGYASSITCAYTGNTISSKMIYVRFTPTVVKSYTGNITNAGGGATTKNVVVTGTGISGISASIVYSPALIMGTLTASQQTLPACGGTVTLQWTSQNADSATISPNIGTVPLNGSINVYVTSETQFILTLFSDTTTVQYPLIVRNSTTSVNSESVRPKSIELGQNYPNPFNPSTVINYQLSVAGKVRLSVHDILGREVITLVNEEKGAGYYSKTFDGSKLSSGTYITRFIFDPENGKQIVQVKKMSLVK